MNIECSVDKVKYGGHTGVPRYIAVCPECGGSLICESQEYIEGTGNPTKGGLDVSCIKDEELMQHRYFQSDWQHIINMVQMWCGAEDN